MTDAISPVLHESRRRPIAACVISIFALSSPAAAIAASTWTVTNCGDGTTGDIPSKTGTLRFGIANAVSGDTIDLSGLISCPGSKISVSTGEIYVDQNALLIKGPGASVLTLDGSGLPSPGGGTGPYDSRIFTHRGTGTLTIQDLSLTGGHVYHVGATYPSRGGCLSSTANVVLTRTKVFACSVYSASNVAVGGGVYAKGNLQLKYSTLSGNTARSGESAQGGGGRSAGGFGAKYSTIDGNKVYGPVVGANEDSYKYATGGGISAGGDVNILRSTVSNNYSNGSFAGVSAQNVLGASSNSVSLYSSTISGNNAAKLVGGVYTDAGAVQLYNSTIAFNTAGVGRIGDSPFNFFGPGLALSAQATDMSVTLQSSLLSNNTYAGFAEVDLTTTLNSINTITFNAAPANNLIRTDFATGLPADTIRFSCPLLGPLRDNGGPTKTHALLSKSPAIDVGNNVIAANDNLFASDQDQRGLSNDVAPFAYPRESNGVADIGAYEVNQDDIVFNSSFEACPELF